jgi:hypothetical protein
MLLPAAEGRRIVRGWWREVHCRFNAPSRSVTRGEGPDPRDGRTSVVSVYGAAANHPVTRRQRSSAPVQSEPEARAYWRQSESVGGTADQRAYPLVPRIQGLTVRLAFPALKPIRRAQALMDPDDIGYPLPWLR